MNLFWPCCPIRTSSTEISLTCVQVTKQTGGTTEENVNHGKIPAEDSKKKMRVQVEENVHYNDVTAEGSKKNQMNVPVVSQNNDLGSKKDDTNSKNNKQMPTLEIFGTNLTKLAHEVW